MECKHKIKKPHWLTIQYCDKKNQLVTYEICVVCKRGMNDKVD
jgi:hypothetical protein